MKPRLATWLVVVLLIATTLAWARPAHADADITIPWSTPTAVATGMRNAAAPQFAGARDGSTHAVWASGGQLYHASRAPGQEWSEASWFAAGLDPSLQVDQTGQLHLLFSNQFFGNYEIYYVTWSQGQWSLPINISHTSGMSVNPVLVQSTAGELYAAWADSSLGNWVIYEASLANGFWSNQDVPSARGQSPALAVTDDGTLFLAWQDRVPTADDPSGKQDIFVSERSRGTWSVSANISDTSDTDSIGVHATTIHSDGMVQMVWVENNRVITYCFGRGLYWPNAMPVATATAMAHRPRVLSQGGNTLRFAWDEGDEIRTTAGPANQATWPASQSIASLQGFLKDVTLAVDDTLTVTLGWVQTMQPGSTGIYESRQTRVLPHHAWMPLVVYDPR